MLIGGDTGGTKTLLGIYGPDTGARAPLFQAEFHSADYPDIAPMVRDFLAQAAAKLQPAQIAAITDACFDVAGPVIDGRAKLTNLTWRLEEAPLAAALGLRRVTLLNDLQAVAYAVPRLDDTERQTLNAGTAQPRGAIGVVAPGTGLGEAFLVWGDGEYIACSSEGGHADFAPATELQAELWGYLAAKFGHVSYERACSGTGIANIYDFLRDTGRSSEPAGFAASLAAAHDRTPLISKAALEDTTANPRAAMAVDIFAEVLAAEAGNLALRVMATGGIFLAGGIPGHILPVLQRPGFLARFAEKGRLAPMLGNVPVYVVTAGAALLGAAMFGLDHLDKPRA